MQRMDWVQGLFSADIDEALRAVEALETQGGSQAVSALMQRVADAPTPLALAIINTLIELKDARAIPALVSCIRSPSEDVRGEALYGIIALSQQRSAVLPDELIKSGNPMQPSRALTQIVYPEDLEAVALLHGLLNDPDPEMRIAAAHGLGSMGALNAVLKLSEIALQDEDDDVQTSASYALGQLVDHGSAEALLTLQKVAATSKSTEALIAAIRTLSAYRPDQHHEYFYKCLTHPDDRLRQLGVIGLGRSESPESAATLLRMLNDASPHVKRLAVHALGQLGAQASVATLIRSGRKAPSELRTAIANTLGEFSKEHVGAELKAASKDSDPAVRQISVYLAGKLGYSALFETLLNDPDESVRKQATLGLSDLHLGGYATVRDALLGALQDRSWKVRVASIESIRRIGDDALIAHLRTLREDPNHVVQQAIRRTLSTF